MGKRVINMDEANRSLTKQQEVFCQEYIFDWNAARAARAAGYSEKTARIKGCQLLTKVNIRAYIAEMQEDIQKQAGISKLALLAKLMEIVEDSNCKDIQEKDKIKAIEVVNKMLGFNAPEQKDITSGGNPVKGIGIIEWVE